MSSRLLLAAAGLALLAAVVLFSLPGVFESAPPGPSAATAPTAVEPAAATTTTPEVEADAGIATAGQRAEQPGRAEHERQAKRSLAWLLDALHNGEQFRVRLQAVSTLGRMRSTAATDALIEALRDPHPAVRRTAVSALARRGGASVQAALRSAEQRESDAKVKAALSRALAKAEPTKTAEPAGGGSARYYVGVGNVAGPGLSSSLLSRVEGMVRSGVRSMTGVSVAPPGESNGAARSALASQSRKGLFLDVSVGDVGQSGAGTSASVSIVVGTYPGRDMRAIVRGKATLPGGTGSEADREKAVEGAVRSALRKLPATFAQAAR